MTFNLGRLMDEIAAAGRTIDGIERTFGYPADKVEPPCLVVTWPERIQYDLTYQDGMHQFWFPVFLVLGAGGTVRTKRDTVADWLSRDVKQAIDGYDYTDDPVVVVTEAEIAPLEIAGNAYLAVQFTVDVTTTT